jgi:hypothetical protein
LEVNSGLVALFNFSLLKIFVARSLCGFYSAQKCACAMQKKTEARILRTAGGIRRKEQSHSASIGSMTRNAEQSPSRASRLFEAFSFPAHSWNAIS